MRTTFIGMTICMDEPTKTVIVSGYFDPLHVGHLDYLEAAAELGDELWVIVNNDEQAKLKKQKPFMRVHERARIIGSLKCVDQVRISFDHDKTILQTLEWLTAHAPHEFLFAKGGDSTPENTPETSLCDRIGLEIRFGVGGQKVQSSSWLTSGLSQ